MFQKIPADQPVLPAIQPNTLITAKEFPRIEVKRIIVNSLKNLVVNNSDFRICDVGCETNLELANLVYEEVPGVTYVGLDSNYMALDRIRLRLEKMGFSIALEDIVNPLDDLACYGKFSALSLTSVIPYWNKEEFNAALENLHDMLDEHGSLFLDNIHAAPLSALYLNGKTFEPDECIESTNPDIRGSVYLWGEQAIITALNSHGFDLNEVWDVALGAETANDASVELFRNAGVKDGDPLVRVYHFRRHT